MSVQPIPPPSRLDRYRQALRNDAAKLERLDRNIAQADSTPGLVDDLDEIAFLLNQRS